MREEKPESVFRRGNICFSGDAASCLFINNLTGLIVIWTVAVALIFLLYFLAKRREKRYFRMGELFWHPKSAFDPACRSAPFFSKNGENRHRHPAVPWIRSLHFSRCAEIDERWEAGL
jgi:hypothetical protein